MIKKICKISLLLGLVMMLCCSKLPKNYSEKYFLDNTKYIESPEFLGYSNKKEFLIYVPIEGKLYFSSSYNIIGLYNKNGILIDEIKIGSIPIKLREWTDTNITLVVTEKRDKEYLDRFLKDINKIGKYRLFFIY